MYSKPFINFMVLALACALPLGAHADTDSHRQAVETLFKLTHMEQKINESVDNVLLMQLQQNPQLAQHRQVLTDFLQTYIGWNSMKEQLAAMYMETFTEKELEQINAFYITPTGQKVITDVPKLVQQRNQLAMQRMQENIGELQKQIGQPAASQ